MTSIQTLPKNMAPPRKNTQQAFGAINRMTRCPIPRGQITPKYNLSLYSIIGNEMMFFSKSRIMVSFFLLIYFFCAHACAAQQILWVTGGWEKSVSSNPYQSCLEFYQAFLDPAAPNSANLNHYEDVKLSRRSGTDFYCGAIETWGGSQKVIENYHTYSTYLYYQPCDTSSGVYYNDPETGICRNRAVSSKAKGIPNIQVCSFSGNPINFSNGNKYQEETDYITTRPEKFVFKRFYNSVDGLWRHSFSSHLRTDGIFMYVVLASGTEVQFEISGSNFIPVKGVLGSLIRYGTDYIYKGELNVTYRFDEKMELIGQDYGAGQNYTLLRDGFNVTVTSAFGKNYFFSEDALRQPLAFNDGVFFIDYNYSGGVLVTASKSIGHLTTERKYTYDDINGAERLSGIFDERGIQTARWKYDNTGRATSSEHAKGAGKVSIVYLDNTNMVEVTNELGKVSKYSFKDVNEISKIISIEGEPTPDCPLSNSLYTYNGQGLLDSSVDAKGFITTYTYNDRGLETSRTEASGTPQARVTTTEWDPTRFLRTKVVEPTRTTVYTYDDQGRETGRQVSAR